MRQRFEINAEELKSVREIVSLNSWNDVFLMENIPYSTAYLLSPLRENVISWYDFKGKNVLEFGAKCGVLTKYLSSVARSVTAIEEEDSLREINELKNSLATNVNIIKSMDAYSGEKVDVIVLIDVITTQKDLVETLSSCLKYLSKDGSIILSADNKLGLRYFTGADERVYKKSFIGIEGYPEVEQTSYSKKEWKAIIDDLGYSNYQIYYPYPDHRFCDSIYTDQYVPRVEDLRNKEILEPRDRFIYLNETRVLYSLINEGLFTSFSDSFLFVIENYDIG